MAEGHDGRKAWGKGVWGLPLPTDYRGLRSVLTPLEGSGAEVRPKADFSAFKASR